MTTQRSVETNDQRLIWNGRSGRAWVETQALMDAMLEPFQRLLVAETPTTARAVLDVGCGAGSTTLALAERLAGIGTATGIDISEPLLGVARQRAQPPGPNATFVLGDAQTHAFEAGRFDAIVSRFGVMFFEDPVRAFVNLRLAARAGAHLAFVAWRSPSENPFMTVAERVAAPLLPNLPVRRSDEPGQFAFADRGRVHEILTQSGWANVRIRPVDVPCTFPASELETYFTRLGPVGRQLVDADSEVRAELVERIGNGFASYVEGARVRFTAACWLVTALVP